jgi:hypothetical protein
MLSIPLMAREIMANYLENLTDGEIYPAYDIIGRILKMKKAAVAAATKGSCNLSVLCAADVWRLRDASGRRIPAGVDRVACIA